MQAGVVLYVCLCGYEPFFGVNEADLIAANRAAVYEFHVPEWEEVSEAAKDLVRQGSVCFLPSRHTSRDPILFILFVYSQRATRMRRTTCSLVDRYVILDPRRDWCDSGRVIVFAVSSSGRTPREREFCDI